ncbi:hypothetical protein AVEN_33775-1 [Araneus ventricosus]|uniref:Uncharacterized protein n=1 Tax=Araneus ventricosus TaxID=182803 RepID=A0A4Y2WCW2_ARAVE|nr:hypothetical protein AVEN_33775-1 [Araneus ventricosus]
MLPVDGRQLENVKGELLKLKKKEAADCPTMAQRGQDRRAEETEEQRNHGTTWAESREEQKKMTVAASVYPVRMKVDGCDRVNWCIQGNTRSALHCFNELHGTVYRGRHVAQEFMTDSHRTSQYYTDETEV